METTPELETRTLLQHEEPPSMEDVQFLVSFFINSSSLLIVHMILLLYYLKSYQWLSTITWV